MEAGLWARAGPPPFPDVTKIPTPPLQRTAVAIVFFFPSLALVVFCMRAYTRARIRQLGLDDLLCGLALLFALLMTGPLFMFIKLNYFGWKAVDVPTYDARPGFWWNFLVQMFYNPVLALVKASILVFLLRLGGHKPGARYAIHTLNAINACHAVAVFFTALFQCLPMEANWDFALKADPNTRCIHDSFHVIASCLTIFTDFLVLALPFWIFLGLKMPWAAKIAIIGVFLIGSVVAVIGIIRVVGIYKLFFSKPDPKADPYQDISLVYASVEVNLAIITASIPTLRPLFRKWFPNLFGGSSKKQSQYPYAQGSSTSRGIRTIGSSHLDRAGDIPLKDVLSSGRRAHTEVTSVSPTGSEERIMGYSGIMRTTNVNVVYESTSKHSGRESLGSD